MNSWTGFDFIIFLIFAVNTVLGMSRGATKEIISTLCLSMGLIFAIKFTIPLTNFFNSSPLITDVISSNFVQNFMVSIGAGPLTADMLYQIAYSLSLLVCFTGAYSACEAGLSVTGAVEAFPFTYAALNRKIGGTLGAIRGYIISLLFISIVTLHVFSNNYSVYGGSFFVGLFQAQTQKFDQIISGQQPERYKEIYEGKDLFKASDVMKQLDSGTTGTEAQPAQPAEPQSFMPSESQPANQ